jgi:hypothetical protein
LDEERNLNSFIKCHTSPRRTKISKEDNRKSSELRWFFPVGRSQTNRHFTDRFTEYILIWLEPFKLQLFLRRWNSVHVCHLPILLKAKLSDMCCLFFRLVSAPDRWLSVQETAGPVLPFCQDFFKTWFKRNTNTNRIFFVTLFLCWRPMTMESFYSWDKKIWSTKNNVRPNCDDSDHVLIITICVDLESERTIRCRCIKWPHIKSHKIRSVAPRSQHVMIISNTLLIHQLKLKSLYSILHIS